jgi:TPR repeat protein
LAQFNLGAYYAQGTGVPQDAAEAAKWYRKAAEQGDPDAQFELGVCYKNGPGVRKSKSQAVKWLQLAASQGHGEARDLLREISMP